MQEAQTPLYCPWGLKSFIVQDRGTTSILLIILLPCACMHSLTCTPVRFAACSLGLSATSNQPAVLFSQKKPAPAISHQPNEQAVDPWGVPPFAWCTRQGPGTRGLVPCVTVQSCWHAGLIVHQRGTRPACAHACFRSPSQLRLPQPDPLGSS
jgi:hypothetical protein